MEDLTRQPQVPKLMCDTCNRSKSHTRNPIKHVSKRYRQVGYKFHTDTSGKIRVKSVQGASYFTVFVDDASGYKFVSLLKTKDSFVKAFDRTCVRLCGTHTSSALTMQVKCVVLKLRSTARSTSRRSVPPTSTTRTLVLRQLSAP